MTFIKFIELYYFYDLANRNKRGKKETSHHALMSFIALHRQDLYRRILGSSFDCTYYIEHVPLVWIWLNKNWDDTITEEITFTTNKKLKN